MNFITDPAFFSSYGVVWLTVLLSTTLKATVVLFAASILVDHHDERDG